MDDGISVFHRGVKVPPTVNPFSVIPKRHLDWFEDTFLHNNRSVPPLPDGIAPTVVPAAIVTVKGNNQLDVIQVAAFSEPVVHAYQFMGMNHVVTKKKIYVGGSERMTGIERAKKAMLCQASDGTVIVALSAVNPSRFHFVELTRQQQIGTIGSVDGFVRNNCVYTDNGNGKLVENSFTGIGNKVIHRATEVENISIYGTTIYEGCAIQNLLGKYFLTLPPKKGACFSQYLPQLDGYRVVDAKSERTVTVIIAEKGGKYDRFIVCFKKDYSDFDVRRVEDIAYDGINFTVLDNGLCILLSSPDDIELFGDNKNVSMLTDPPFDSTMKLFSTPDGAFFINGNTIHQLKRK